MSKVFALKPIAPFHKSQALRTETLPSDGREARHNAAALMAQHEISS